MLPLIQERQFLLTAEPPNGAGTAWPPPQRRQPAQPAPALDVQMMPHESDTCPSDDLPKDIDKDSTNQVYKENTTMPSTGDRHPPEEGLRTSEGRKRPGMAECDKVQGVPRVVHNQTMEDDSSDDDVDPLIRNTANALARTKDRLQNNPWLIAPNNGLHAHVDRMHAIPVAHPIPAPQPTTKK